MKEITIILSEEDYEGIKKSPLCTKRGVTKCRILDTIADGILAVEKEPKKILCSEKNDFEMISVKDKLPELEQEVLLYTEHFGFIVGLYTTSKYRDEAEYVFLVHYSIASDEWAEVEAIAWMPLPEPNKTSLTGAESEDEE